MIGQDQNRTATQATILDLRLILISPSPLLRTRHQTSLSSCPLATLILLFTALRKNLETDESRSFWRTGRAGEIMGRLQWAGRSLKHSVRPSPLLRQRASCRSPMHPKLKPLVLVF